MNQEFFNDLYGWVDMEHFSKALDIAKKAHAGQFRDEGKPYIAHIEGVVRILTDELDIQSDTVLSVAALHDVLEDSDMFTYENLKSEFGKTIAEGVLLLTKKDNQDMSIYMENINNAPGMSWLMLVKMADRIHNLRCLKYTNNPDKIRRKCQETRQHFLKYAESHTNINNINKMILSELIKLEAVYVD